MAETKKKPTMEEIKNAAEQLNEINQRLQQENEQLKNYIKETHTQEAIARLNFLFKIVEFAKAFDKEYVADAVADIKRILVMEDPNIDVNETAKTE